MDKTENKDGEKKSKFTLAGNTASDTRGEGDLQL
jgi:hypothetical protein